MANRRVLFRKRPLGPVTPDCFEIADATLPELGDGDVLVRNIYLSSDPYMRGRMDQGGAFGLGQVIPARVVGAVAGSRNPGFEAGDIVWGFLGWELFSLVEGGEGLRKVDPALGPISHAISVRGMPGLTAYVGTIDIGQPRPGQTFFVSSASGAVGQVAGQLAKREGCRVVGSAGSDLKIAHITGPLGFDAAFNYKTVASIAEALDQCCPDGIDIYFDNVGGETLDAVLARLNDFARIAVCGQISQYDGVDAEGLKNIGAMLKCRATMTGFSIYNHMDQYDAFLPRMAEWLKSGEIVYFEDVVDGLDNAPEAFISMMAGDNVGKRLIRVSEDPTHG